MGAWGTGIFDDDIALDIKEEFNEAVRESLSIQEATEQILENYEEVLEDEEEAGIVYLALAELQIKKKKLQHDIKKKALEVIESGRDLNRWKDTGKDYSKRKKVLEELKVKLLEQ